MAEKPTYEELEQRIRVLEQRNLECSRTERLLQEDSEEQFKKLADYAPVQISLIVLDDDTRYLYVNREWENILGYTKDELNIVKPLDIVHPDMQQTVLKKAQKRLDGQNVPDRYELRVVTKSGEIKTLDFSAIPITHNNKQAILTTAIDISDRKSMEEALREREGKYRLLFNMGVNAMFLVDNNTTQILECNNKASQLFGYSSQELLSMKMTDLSTTPEATRRACQENVSKMERVYQKKDGGLISVDITSEHFYLADRAVHISAIQDITEKKLAEEALQKSEERLKLALDSVSDAVWDWRMDTGEVYFSSRWYTMLGYKPYELPQVFETWRKLLHPDDLPGSEAEVFHHLEMAEPFEIEFRMRTKDNHWRWILARGKTVEQDDEGKAVRMLGTHIDITERKQAEEVLRESENQINSIFRSAPIGIGSVVNRVLSKVNTCMCAMTGYDETELIGQSSRMLYPSDEDFEFVGREKYAQIAEHGTGTIETCWQKKDGGIMDVLLSSTPVDLQDHSKGVTFTALDITKQKQSEKALLKSEERFSLAMEASKDGIWDWDLTTGEIYCSPSLTSMLGFDSTDVIKNADQWKELVHPEDRQKAYQVNMDCVNNLTDSFEVEYRIQTKHGGWKWIVGRGKAVHRDASGRALRIIGTHRDNTDHKRAEAEKETLQIQLHQSQKMESVGRLAGGVAHDFNNMLGVILGHTEMALLQADENHDLHDDLKEIQKAAKRSADITKQLLAFARKQTISPKQLNLNDTVESMLNMLRRLIGEDIDLVWKPDAHIWPVKMDTTQIDQILANLCINARDSIAGVGKLTIETGKKSFDDEYCRQHSGFTPGDFVQLAVSDNGCGMDKDTLDNVFEPFFTTKEVGKGTGLGLATVYGIVKQNSGFINVYSEPDRGSTFKIYLPRTSTDKNTDKVLPEKKPAAGGTETILLVEDEPTILRMTRMMLEKKGYSVLSAATPAEAVEKATNHSDSIDLLMTDVVMPEMNGRDLAGQITDLYPDIRLLFMSGYTADVIAHQGVLDDGVAFIQKPFSLADMTEKVRELLDMTSDEN